MFRRSLVKFVGVAVPVTVLAIAGWTTVSVAQEHKADEKKPAATAKKDVVDTIAGSADHKTLAKLIKAGGLEETLKGKGPFTVFGPTDAAFDKLGKDKVADWMKPENKSKLADILKNHVVAGNVKAAEVTKMTSAKMVGGGEFPIVSKDGKVMIGGATVTKTDIEAGNGTIHVIDGVLMAAPKAEPKHEEKKPGGH
ncbi:MAG: fasciclin domain-containing protein [Phycisphaerae bacterium]